MRFVNVIHILERITSMSIFNVTVRSISPIMMHKFNGTSEGTRMKALPDMQQAEASAYRMNGEKSNLAIPGAWITGCLIESFIRNAGRNQKGAVELEVAPALQVEETLIDLKIRDFMVDKRSIPIKKNGKTTARDFCVRPKVDLWKVAFTLQSVLERPDKDIEEELRRAGKYVGIGSGRKIGFGRFEVLTFEKLKE